MIPFMAWNAIPSGWRTGISIALVLGLLGVLGGAYAYVRHQGYEAGYSRAAAECEMEKAAQAEANRKAISEAEKRLLRNVDQLSLKNLELDDAIKSLSDAAAADPDGALECLGADSLRRLNQIGR